MKRVLIKAISLVGMAFNISLLFLSCVSSSEYFLPGEKEALISNINSEYYIIANEYMKLAKYDKAIFYFNEALDKGYKNPEDVELRLARCNALSGNYKKSVELYQGLLLKDSNNTLIKKSLAYVYFMEGNFVASQDIYEKLYKEHFYDSSISKNYIKVLLAQDKYEEATQIYSEFVINFPEDSELEQLKKLLTSVEKDTDGISQDLP
jgi:tetratricopeptide (TPR) repeat protein